MYPLGFEFSMQDAQLQVATCNEEQHLTHASSNAKSGGY